MAKNKMNKKILAMLLALVFVFSMIPTSVFATGEDDSYLGVQIAPEVPESFQNDLWLQYEQKELAVGETTKIVPRRVEEGVSNTISNDVEMPNFHYEIISGDSITLDTTDNLNVIVTAVKAGDTVVKVTYDEFTHTKGKFFPEMDDINTAYCVISVGGDEAITFDTSISTLRQDGQTAIENPTSYDTLYYSEGETYSFPFTATTNAEDLVVTVNGIEIEGTDGSYVAPLENRSNIIMMKATNTDGSTRTFARVIDARKFEVIVNNKTNPGEVPMVGDTVNISFNGITMPVYKLATIYNPQMGAWGGNVTRTVYTNGEDTYEGKCGQYDLATNNDFDYVCTEVGEVEFTNGHIYSAWWGSPLGTEKNQDDVGNPNLNAPTLEGEFSVLPDFTITVSPKVEKINVNLSMEQDNYYTVLPQDVEVSSDLSDKYGYVDTVEGEVSALDALIKTHEILFEDAFTKEDKDAYLVVNGSGFITTIMGEETTGVSFVVNGLMPHNDVLTDAYGGSAYTGYSVNQAALAEGDTVQYFFYNPNGYWGEIYSNFNKDGERVTELNLATGEEVDLSVTGYSYMFEGCNENIVWKAVKEAQIATVVMNGDNAGELENLDGVMTDDEGNVTVSFDKAGTYYLALTSDPDNFTYIVPQILKVTVKDELTLTLPENIVGEEGTEFNAVVTANKWTDNTVKMIDGIYNIPEGLEVVGVAMSNSVTGGTLDYNVKDNKLRFAYMSDTLGDITLSTSTLPVELMTITFRVKDTVKEDTTFEISAESVSLKSDSLTSEEFSVFTAKDEVVATSPIPDPVASGRVLYVGDDSDLISSDKQAVAVEILNLQDTSKVMFGNVEMMYSQEMTDKKGVDTYVAIVDADVTVDDLNNIDSYTITTETPENITFADVNEDEVVNAQDALNTLSFWLRETTIENDKEILTANVNGDSAITTVDVLAIMENVVNARDLEIISK